jgi:hypothetical protein
MPFDGKDIDEVFDKISRGKFKMDKKLSPLC